MRIIEGKNPVIEALRSDSQIDTVLVSSEMSKGLLNKITHLAKTRNIPVKSVDNKALDRLSENKRHQGVIAEAREYEYKDIEYILNYAKEKGEKPFVIILDQVTDVHNLGAIIRSAECLGAHGVIIPKRRAAGINSVVAKSSAGAVEFLPVARVANISNAIDELKKKGLWIYGADMNGKNICEEKFDVPAGLVIGNEGTGLGRIVREKCDFLVSIPMKGNIDSLNASCAASIIIYEIVKQRGI
jgi:23S rRNA (guanosine2251-2'-O)-methyltransferase